LCKSETTSYSYFCKAQLATFGVRRESIVFQSENHNFFNFNCREIDITLGDALFSSDPNSGGLRLAKVAIRSGLRFAQLAQLE
jgi:hypothetical protein